MCPKKYEIHITNAEYGHHQNGEVHVNHELHGLGTTNELDELRSQNTDNKGNLIIREGVKLNGD